MGSSSLKTVNAFTRALKSSNCLRMALVNTISKHNLATHSPAYKLNDNKLELEQKLEKDVFSSASEIVNNEFWLRKMRTVHNIMDINKDGVISYDDFMLLADRFVQLGNLSEDQKRKFYNHIEHIWTVQWGCNHRYAFITTEQYLKDMKHVILDQERRKHVHSVLPYLFAAVDHNQDGTISFAEFQLFFNCLGLSYDDSTVTFAAIDEDRNGLLAVQEFVRLGQRYFLSADQNDVSKHFWGPLTM